jgi:hypothetical protein
MQEKKNVSTNTASTTDPEEPDIFVVRPALGCFIAKISAFYRLLIVEAPIPSLALN